MIDFLLSPLSWILFAIGSWRLGEVEEVEEDYGHEAHA